MTALSPLTTRISDEEVIRAGDVADFCDEIWANAFGTAPLGKPEPVSRLGPNGRVSLSQERGK